MTEELKQIGLDVGHCRVGRLAQNEVTFVRTRKQKATTDSDPKFNISPHPLHRDLTAKRRNQK